VIGDLATREGVLAFLDAQKNAVVGLFERAGEVRPYAIIFSDRSPSGEPFVDRMGKRVTKAGFIFPEDLGDPRAKDDFVSALGHLLERAHACGVMFVAETWHAAPPPGGGRDDLPQDFSAPFQGRREAIMVLLEHVALEKPVMEDAEIERSASGKGYVKPFVADPNTVRLGRFTHLLKRADS
jgi:hypothetical protein